MSQLILRVPDATWSELSDHWHDSVGSEQFREPEFWGESDTDSSIGTIIGCGRTGTSRN